jgi:feruloyl esterase
MRTAASFLALAALGACAATGGSASDLALPAAPTADCASLVRARLPDPTTTITSAVLQTAALPAANAPPTPAHCEVFGKLQERVGANGQTYAIKFHLRLPTAWNGRFFFQGGGGSNGVVGNALGNLMGAQPGNALSLGYAVISQDSGHDNAVNNDPQRQGVVTFGWDAEARRNYGGASIGPVVRAGKALVTAYYARGPALTYFAGGSKGGQEGMMAVQRFPNEFDAVLVGYPGFRLAYAGGVAQMWDAQAFAEAARTLGHFAPDGQALLNRAMSDDDLLLTSNAVLAACDRLDGTTDGMVENFAACTTARVSPALAAVTCPGAKTPACLAPAQVAALTKVFGGARARDGRPLYADWPWDAGIAARTGQGVSQGWRQWKMGPYASGVNSGLAVILGGASASAVFTSPPTAVPDDPAALTRYALAVDVEENAARAKVKWGAFNESSVDFMNADAVDLSRFARRGGKLLIYHGVADPVFSINDTIAWLKAVDAREGGRADRFVRLFAVPGMNHGGGGPATDQFDAFGALVAWRERGVAPEALVATARETSPWPGRTRLLCPFPLQPRRVAADIEQAASFRCARP